MFFRDLQKSFEQCQVFFPGYLYITGCSLSEVYTFVAMYQQRTCKCRCVIVLFLSHLIALKGKREPECLGRCSQHDMLSVDIRDPGFVIFCINDWRMTLDGGGCITLLMRNSDNLIDSLLRQHGPYGIVNDDVVIRIDLIFQEENAVSY